MAADRKASRAGARGGSRRASPVRAGPKAAPANRGRAAEFLSAALDLFARRNFSSVTIKDIAREVGANPALIYYYYTSKEDLYRAAIETAADRAFEHFDELRDKHSDPADVINDWLENHVDLYDPIHKLVKVALDYAGSARRLPSVERTIGRFYRKESEVLSKCVAEGVAQNLFRAVDPGVLAQFISTYLDGLMVRSVIMPEFDLRRAVDLLALLLWRELGYRPGPGGGRRIHN